MPARRLAALQGALGAIPGGPRGEPRVVELRARRSTPDYAYMCIYTYAHVPIDSCILIYIYIYIHVIRVVVVTSMYVYMYVCLLVFRRVAGMYAKNKYLSKAKYIDQQRTQFNSCRALEEWPSSFMSPGSALPY